MKVYLDPAPGLSRAIWRVACALKDYAPPWVTVVQELAQADFQVIHALGNGERVPLLGGIAAGTQIPFAVVQYCLRTTETPHTGDWLGVWAQATSLWSYYDLPARCEEDGTVFPGGDRFYHAPLGVDPAFTRQYNRDAPTYLVGTSGYVAATEGVGEWAAVLQRVTRRGFHLGPRLAETPGTHWTVAPGALTDAQVAQAWSQCRYVAAMRRVEGFEFPGIEGLVCGARPVCFRRPHYETWYESAAEYVEERDFDSVVEDLCGLVTRPYRAVTAKEIAWAQTRFNWRTLVPGFWARVEGAV